MTEETNSPVVSSNPNCFVIMPVTDPDGYPAGHFQRVYLDIIYPACQQAGFNPIRADEIKHSDHMDLDILQKLLESPMAICDLSTKNPNVLVYLALRQAFDKPVALIQEAGTPDIAPLRYTEYRKERIYHEVLEDQQSIADAVRETFESDSKGDHVGGDINSIVKLLSLSNPAAFTQLISPEAKDDFQQRILSELSDIKNEMRLIRREVRLRPHQDTPVREVRPSIDLSKDLDNIYETLREIIEETRLPEKGNIAEARVQLEGIKQRLSKVKAEFERNPEALLDVEKFEVLQRRVNVVDLELQGGEKELHNIRVVE